MDDPWVRLRDFRHALTRLGEVLASTRDRQVMVSALLDASTTYLGARCGVLWVTVAGSERLRPMETAGPPCAPSELAAGSGLAGAAARTGGPVLWPGDGGAVRPAPQEPDGDGGAVAIPLRSGGHPFGVLAYYGRPTAFDGEDVDSLVILVRQAETAIEN
ncbi:MAG: GAF domain-containing protein, partial [Actinomycetota bacterium]|nr:GAF domain-containing protein [Actinomycetota bacterium]